LLDDRHIDSRSDETGTGDKDQQSDPRGRVFNGGQGTPGHVDRQRNRVPVEQIHPIPDRSRRAPQCIEFGIERINRHPAGTDRRLLVQPRNPLLLFGMAEQRANLIGGLGLIHDSARRARRDALDHRHGGWRRGRHLGKAESLPAALAQNPYLVSGDKHDTSPSKWFDGTADRHSIVELSALSFSCFHCRFRALANPQRILGSTGPMTSRSPASGDVWKCYGKPLAQREFSGNQRAPSGRNGDHEFRITHGRAAVHDSRPSGSETLTPSRVRRIRKLHR
jgi:hypothetical protein